MINLVRGGLAAFYKLPGNHNVSFAVKVPENEMVIGIRHPAYGTTQTDSAPFVAIVNPHVPDVALRIVVNVADLHGWHEVKVFHEVISLLVTTHTTELTAVQWGEFITRELGYEVEVTNYAL